LAFLEEGEWGEILRWGDGSEQGGPIREIGAGDKTIRGKMEACYERDGPFLEYVYCMQAVHEGGLRRSSRRHISSANMAEKRPAESAFGSGQLQVNLEKIPYRFSREKGNGSRRNAVQFE